MPGWRRRLAVEADADTASGLRARDTCLTLCTTASQSVSENQSIFEAAHIIRKLSVKRSHSMASSAANSAAGISCLVGSKICPISARA